MALHFQHWEENHHSNSVSICLSTGLNLHYVQTESATLLIDCSPPFRYKSIRYNFSYFDTNQWRCNWIFSTVCQSNKRSLRCQDGTEFFGDIPCCEKRLAKDFTSLYRNDVLRLLNGDFINESNRLQFVLNQPVSKRPYIKCFCGIRLVFRTRVIMKGKAVNYQKRQKNWQVAETSRNSSCGRSGNRKMSMKNKSTTWSRLLKRY